MNRYISLACDVMLSACIIYGAGIFAYKLYALGYMNGAHTYGIKRSVKNRIKRDGNLIKYPFGKKPEKVPHIIEGECSPQTGEGPEAA